MAKSNVRFRCDECGYEYSKWIGRCQKCGNYSSVNQIASEEDKSVGLKASAKPVAPTREARTVHSVQADRAPKRISTGIGELDRVLGGGLVPGQVCLISGSPGSGKSTLLLKAAHCVAEAQKSIVLYISGEESVQQIAVRAHRIGATSDNLLLADETDLNKILGHIEQHSSNIALIVIDSVQTIASGDVDGRAGGVAQVMEVAHVMTRTAKEKGLPIFIVGQVTKDSNLAGPRALEHLVDSSLSIEGDRHTSLRLLRAVKNRFGALEVAAFEQTDAGMEEVLDPSLLFRGSREEPVPGTCLTVVTEGARALTAEVQALIAHTTSPNPRRGFSGLDSARTSMLVAVTERAGRLRLYDKDVFIATVGGHRISDPGADLAVCLATVSAATDSALPLGLAAIGEVALSGDVRPVSMLNERVAEAARLGHRPIFVPPHSQTRLSGKARDGVIVEVSNLREAVQALKLKKD